MAVTPQPPLRIKDFWPRFRRRSALLVVTMQLLAAVVVVAALIVGGVADMNHIGFWIIIGAMLVTSIGVNSIMLSITTAPIKTVSHALSHVAGENSASTPPNPNARPYERSGLKPLLQMIYDLKSNPDTSLDVVNAAPSFDYQRSLDQSTSGIIFLREGKVVYANTAAPVHTSTQGERVIDLIFESDDNLQQWIDASAGKAVHSERTWRRVANKLTGEEDRKIYDISASYQHGTGVDTILVLMERTEDYLPADKDLDFISFAAHELRGPITVIRGYLDTLNDELDSRLAADEQELFNRLIVSANRLSSYINNILNAAKYDRRHLKVYLREEQLSEIYDVIKDDMELRASSQNRLLSVTLDPNLPTVAADRASIGEVIGNLVDNAIKYSNEGGSISVSAQQVDGFIEVAISDQGIGMPGNVISNLFHKFYRSHRSRETVAGTGIGLYICKAIVESHGGIITVRSVEGQGSVFTFTLPVYATVAEKLKSDNNSNQGLIRNHDGWIKNHGTYRG